MSNEKNMKELNEDALDAVTGGEKPAGVCGESTDTYQVVAGRYMCMRCNKENNGKFADFVLTGELVCSDCMERETSIIL